MRKGGISGKEFITRVSGIMNNVSNFLKAIVCQ